MQGKRRSSYLLKERWIKKCSRESSWMNRFTFGTTQICLLWEPACWQGAWDRLQSSLGK